MMRAPQTTDMLRKLRQRYNEELHALTAPETIAGSVPGRDTYVRWMRLQRVRRRLDDIEDALYSLSGHA
jgi:uncharacterized protein YjiS (DUF1127 family)